MGYIYLLLSNLAGACKGFCGKKVSSFVKGTRDAVLSNIIRMLLCMVIGFGLLAFTVGLSSVKISLEILLITVLSGVSTSFFVVLWLISVKKSAYVMLDVFLMLGILVPTVSTFLLFDEKIRINQIIGFGILLIATVIMCSYNNSIKTKLSVGSFAILVLCGVANGITDLSQKLFIYKSSGISVSVFNFYTYLFSAITLLIIYAFLTLKAKREEKTDTNETTAITQTNALGKISVYITVMSVCLFLNSYFKTMAAITVPSAVLYPCTQGIALVLSTLMSVIFFKEKLTVKCALGVVITFIGLLVINCF